MYIPLIILALMFTAIPHNVEAKEKQTIVVDSKKKLTYNEQQKLKKQLKKCKVAIDKKTKKGIHVCPK